MQFPVVKVIVMGKPLSRRRRQKDRRAKRAALAAQRSIRTVEQVEARMSAKAQDPLTDISSLRVSVEDVMNAGVRTEPMRWCVARVSPTAERRIMEALKDRRIVAYMPMHRFRRRVGRYTYTLARPLMVGYLFVGLAPHQSIYDLRGVDGVEGVLKRIGGETAFISPWAVVAIAALEAAGAFDRANRGPVFRKDQVVKIISGIAAGHEATVVDAEDGGLRVTFERGLFKGQALSMDADKVEPVDEKDAA